MTMSAPQSALTDWYLNNQRSVFLVSGPLLLSILVAIIRVAKKSGMEHGSEAQVGVVATAKNAPGMLRLVYHGSDNVLWGSDGPEKVVARQLLFRSGLLFHCKCSDGG